MMRAVGRYECDSLSMRNVKFERVVIYGFVFTGRPVWYLWCQLPRVDNDYAGSLFDFTGVLASFVLLSSATVMDSFWGVDLSLSKFY